MELTDCKYGVSKTFDMPLITYGATDFKTGVTLAAGDVKISKDGGAFTNIATLPTINGAWAKVTLSATEMQASRIAVQFIDQDATKIYEDTGAILTTEIINKVWDEPLTGTSHNVATSAGRRIRTLGDVLGFEIVTDGGNTSVTFKTNLPTKPDDFYRDQVIYGITGNNAGATATVLSYNGTTGFITIDEALTSAPVGGDGFDLRPEHVHPVSQIADSVWDEVLTSGTHNVANSAGKRVRDLKEQAGYAGGFIYIDTVGGAAGSDPYVNGTLDNPVNNIADANILAAALNFSNFHVKSGSSITFAASQEREHFTGESWTLALGGQSISGTYIKGAAVSGICTGAVPPVFEQCEIDGTTLPPSHFDGCGFNGTMIVGSAGDFFFTLGSHSSIAGTGTPIFDYGAAIGATNFNFRGYHGGIKLLNMQTGDNFSHDGDGQIIIDGTCTGGTMRISGHQALTGADAFETAGGTILDDARFATDQLSGVGTTYLADLIISEKVNTLLDINKPLNLTVNATTTLEYQWLDVDGDPVNITGLTFYFKGVKNAGEASPAIPSVSGTIQDAVNGRWKFDVLPTTTFKGRYEIWAVDGGGIITQLSQAGGTMIEVHPRL